VWTTAWPMKESGGQLAGLASKTFARQAFWRVVNRDGSEIGSSTFTLAMLDSTPCPVNVLAAVERPREIAPYAC